MKSPFSSIARFFRDVALVAAVLFLLVFGVDFAARFGWRPAGPLGGLFGGGSEAVERGVAELDRRTALLDAKVGCIGTNTVELARQLDRIEEKLDRLVRMATPYVPDGMRPAGPAAGVERPAAER